MRKRCWSRASDRSAAGCGYRCRCCLAACIAPLLTELTREHPGLELELSFNDRVVELIEDGFDMAIRNGTLANSGGLVARRIGDHRMALCASPAICSGAVNRTASNSWHSMRR